MASRKMVGEMIKFYYELDDILGSMAGNVDIEYITELKDLQIKIDKLLKNISKRWANGNRSRGYIPVRFVNEDVEDSIVHVSVNTL